MDMCTEKTVAKGLAQNPEEEMWNRGYVWPIDCLSDSDSIQAMWYVAFDAHLSWPNYMKFRKRSGDQELPKQGGLGCWSAVVGHRKMAAG